jgi:predicted nuclease with RNAse H fold
MNQPLSNNSCFVIGIDVGGPKKGFHAVALREGCYEAKFAALNASAVVDWCLKIGARAIGIDAPCRWSSTGRARTAERSLAKAGISTFATPSREVAETRPFNRWMLNAAELLHLIERHYVLFDGSHMVTGPMCFETFPQAVACALAGEIVSAKRKGIVRRELLRKRGINTAVLTNIDTVDAALCALTAHYFLAGNVKTYGDATDGYIVVPGTI